jgi:geranylgeranyl diphosphate synthase type I
MGERMIEAKVTSVRDEQGAAVLPSTFDGLLTAVRARVDARLESWLGSRVAAARHISADVGVVAEAIAGLALRGGKRMRAALVAAGFATKGPETRLIAACEPAMIAIELLQTYLLIHDDWMDDDDVRRGGPSVHVLLGQRFGGKTAGDAGAVLAGDLASGFAQEALLETDLAPDRVLGAARAFACIQSDVVRGQLAEMRFGGRGAGPSVEAVHALKTASYTVTGPLLVGAALAGADDAVRKELERFGRPLGVAFQLRDDLLGVFGDPSATGKPVWNDLRQGKRTALVAELGRDARGEALLANVLGNASAPDAEVAAVVRAMEDTGARARVEARVRELCDEARGALAAMGPSISKTSATWLGGAVSALGDRAA